MNEIKSKLRLTIKKLKALKAGETRIFVERPNSNPGTATQSKAHACGIKVKTESCWIIYTKSEGLIKAITVTRL